ncbi:MAG: hypothetical protein O2960_26065 [Verrucomicrobia bacterium]|nr:hypothetical protein [Verrucomicrobiota bacterium]
MKMKLQQSQVWKRGDIYVRIVRLERLSVDYKATDSPHSRIGTHHHVTKKEFCRLLKDATLCEAERPAPITGAKRS